VAALVWLDVELESLEVDGVLGDCCEAEFDWLELDGVLEGVCCATMLIAKKDIPSSATIERSRFILLPTSRIYL
jgi:hypothetical protein